MQKVDNYPLFKQLFLLGKKVVLFPEIGRVKFFLSPTRPHKSNAYEYIYIYIYIFVLKNKHTNKNISTQQIYSYKFTFFPFKQKNVGHFPTKKSALRVVF